MSRARDIGALSGSFPANAIISCGESPKDLQGRGLLEHLEHMGREEQSRTWHMDAAQLDTQRKKEEAILKTSSTILLDRPSFNSIELRSQQSNPKNVASPLTFL
ncbi:unnamed protein product [Microthlaspi erraticum]|uniref:Uncharacterized protein n=1 Tax=Microthlaspi erraticum TaxID=1685480 RepID=A0A6D2KAJ2_9BRAS|nr:unnamed protein product [Microthlaspi erraticum]